MNLLELKAAREVAEMKIAKIMADKPLITSRVKLWLWEDTNVELKKWRERLKIIDYRMEKQVTYYIDLLNA